MNQGRPPESSTVSGSGSGLRHERGGSSDGFGLGRLAAGFLTVRGFASERSRSSRNSVRNALSSTDMVKPERRIGIDVPP
jgi:hypothetical protein